MITVFGEGRGFRVVWLLEEMGLAYRLRRVDLLAGVENDAEFLAIKDTKAWAAQAAAKSRA
jgi:glutathione S-transferase